MVVKCGLFNLREELKLQVSKNKVLRKIFVSKRAEVSWQVKILHNKELNDLYRSPNIVRIVK
jgi:hypothetical protein